MKTTYNDPQVKLNTNRRGKTDYDIVVYGTRSLRKQLDDTVAAAIRRYMEEKEIGTRKLSRLTGIPKGTISRYRNGTAKYDPDYLCAICIALRLQTCRQRHLFRMLNWKMPDERGRKRNSGRCRRSVPHSAVPSEGGQVMTGFFYMHFGDDVPKNIEKEYNRLLLHEQYLEKKEQKYRIQTATFEDVITVCPDPATLPINEIELERERLHNERLKYLPVALNLLKADYPDLYRLIVEYYYAETKTTMADLGKRHGLTTETVRYRIKSAKEKLKLYIIMHENKE